MWRKSHEPEMRPVGKSYWGNSDFLFLSMPVLLTEKNTFLVCFHLKILCSDLDFFHVQYTTLSIPLIIDTIWGV